MINELGYLVLLLTGLVYLFPELLRGIGRLISAIVHGGRFVCFFFFRWRARQVDERFPHPRHVLLILLGDESDPLEDVGDVVYAPFLHPQIQHKLVQVHGFSRGSP
jgi:hypothetical protein